MNGLATGAKASTCTRTIFCVNYSRRELCISYLISHFDV
jgi:hypothetical protein